MKHTTTFENIHLRPLICGYVTLGANYDKWIYTNATAPFWRIYWNDRPGASIFQDKRRIELKPEFFVIIPPNAVFSTNCNVPVAVHHFYLQFHIHPLLAGINTGAITLATTDIAHAMIMHIIKHLQNQRAAQTNKLGISLAAGSLIEWTLAGISPNLQVGAISDARILKTIDYILQQLAQPLSNEDLARQADMSTNAFRTLFKAQTGQTPHAYVRAKRLEKAAHLLLDGNSPVKQITETTGFYDCRHLARVFRRFYGMTPDEFRRSHAGP